MVTSHSCFAFTKLLHLGPSMMRAMDFLMRISKPKISFQFFLPCYRTIYTHLRLAASENRDSKSSGDRYWEADYLESSIVLVLGGLAFCYNSVSPKQGFFLLAPSCSISGVSRGHCSGPKKMAELSRRLSLSYHAGLEQDLSEDLLYYNVFIARIAIFPPRIVHPMMLKCRPCKVLPCKALVMHRIRPHPMHL
jgi:hypothetical protein